MTDLELCVACAKAMGLIHNFRLSGTLFVYNNDDSGNTYRTDYDPLHDNAQAMALLKNYPTQILPELARHALDRTEPFNLNRAICLCVASITEQGGK